MGLHILVQCVVCVIVFSAKQVFRGIATRLDAAEFAHVHTYQCQGIKTQFEQVPSVLGEVDYGHMGTARKHSPTHCRIEPTSSPLVAGRHIFQPEEVLVPCQIDCTMHVLLAS